MKQLHNVKFFAILKVKQEQNNVLTYTWMRLYNMWLLLHVHVQVSTHAVPCKWRCMLTWWLPALLRHYRSGISSDCWSDYFSQYWAILKTKINIKYKSWISSLFFTKIITKPVANLNWILSINNVLFMSEAILLKKRSPTELRSDWGGNTCSVNIFICMKLD